MFVALFPPSLFLFLLLSRKSIKEKCENRINDGLILRWLILGHFYWLSWGKRGNWTNFSQFLGAERKKRLKKGVKNAYQNKSERRTEPSNLRPRLGDFSKTTTSSFWSWLKRKNNSFIWFWSKARKVLFSLMICSVLVQPANHWWSGKRGKSVKIELAEPLKEGIEKQTGP